MGLDPSSSETQKEGALLSSLNLKSNQDPIIRF